MGLERSLIPAIRLSNKKDLEIIFQIFLLFAY